MNTEREELEDAIARAAYNYNPDRGRDGNDVPFEQGDTSYEKSEAKVVAEALIAAGYRKPRIITTLDELYALPSGTVIRDSYPMVLELGRYVAGHELAWHATFPESGYGQDFGYDNDQIDLPATVLYVPTEEK